MQSISVAFLSAPVIRSTFADNARRLEQRGTGQAKACQTANMPQHSSAWTRHQPTGSTASEPVGSAQLGNIKGGHAWENCQVRMNAIWPFPGLTSQRSDTSSDPEHSGGAASLVRT